MHAHSKLKTIASWVFALLFFLLAAVAGTYPLAFKLGEGVLDPGDGVLNTWILAWGATILARNPGQFFQAPYFYPARDALAFSENLLGNLPLFGPLLAFSGDPVWAANAFLVLSVALTGLATYALLLRWTGSRTAALAGGLLFALSPVRMSQVNHLQLFGLWWTPLTLLATSAFLRGARWRHGFAAALCLALQFSSSVYLGYFLLITLASYVLARLWRTPDLRTRTLAIRGAMLLAGTGLALGGLLWPYLRLSRTWGMSRTLRDGTALGADLLSYLSAWPHSIPYGGRLAAVLPLYAHEKYLFPGLVVLALAAWALGWAFSRRREKLSQEARAVAFAGTVAWLLSLGPTLQVRGIITFLPLPYAALFYLVPGFSAIRVPARLGLMVALCLSVLAGIGLSRLIARHGTTPLRRGAIAAAALALVLVDTHHRPLTLYPRPVPSALDRALSRAPMGPGVFVPMPTYKREADGILESGRMLLTLPSGRSLVNGYSGFFPDSYLELARHLENGPTPEALDALAATGVTWLGVRYDQMTPGERLSWDPAEVPGGLQLLWREAGQGALYRIDRKPKPSPLAATLALPPTLSGDRAFTLALTLEAPHGTWVAPAPAERRALRISWQGASPRTEERKVWLPLSLQGSRSIGVPMRTPRKAGNYLLTVEGPDFVATSSVAIGSQAMPDTLTAPIQAQVSWQNPPPPPRVLAGQRLLLEATIRNEGGNVWRAATTWRERLAARPEWLRKHPRWIFDNGAGEVGVAVRWTEKSTGAEIAVGQARPRRYPLAFDVFPKETYRFEEHLFAPEAPGTYVAELRLADGFDAVAAPLAQYEITVE
ncbi:hypothetical protein J7643_18400 [bacterium]|nr:hypothetical protein [bacterium]